MDAAQEPRSESLVRVVAFRAYDTYPNTTPALCESRRRLRGHPEVRVADHDVTVIALEASGGYPRRLADAHPLDMARAANTPIQVH